MRRENFQGIGETQTGLAERWLSRERVASFPCRYLVEGSCGIPFYCEELLRNLDHHKVLVFQPLESEEKTNVTWNNLFSKCPSAGSVSPCPPADRRRPWPSPQSAFPKGGGSGQARNVGPLIPDRERM